MKLQEAQIFLGKISCVEEHAKLAFFTNGDSLKLQLALPFVTIFAFEAAKVVRDIYRKGYCGKAESIPTTFQLKKYRSVKKALASEGLMVFLLQRSSAS